MMAAEFSAIKNRATSLSLRAFSDMMRPYLGRLEPPSGKLVQQHIRKEVLLKYGTGAYLAGMLHVVGVERGKEEDGKVVQAIEQAVVPHTFGIPELKSALKGMARARNLPKGSGWKTTAKSVAASSSLHSNVVIGLGNGARSRQEVCLEVVQAIAVSIGRALAITDGPNGKSGPASKYHALDLALIGSR